MQSPKPKPPLIVILGPTAVGKTETSITLAERLNAEIISADSRLFYRGMDIGTAKPSREERRRAPHHLIDVADPDQIWSLAKYLRAARETIDDIHARGKLPFLVGGTGQYIRAMVEGWQVPEVNPDPRLRDRLEAWAEQIGPEGLHARLQALDPKAAAKIDPPNLRRTVRALEVILTTGQPFSRQKGRKPPPYAILQIGLRRPREEIYERVDARIHKMLETGLIEETQALLDQGYSPELPPLSAIGYRQVIQYLNDEISLEDVITQMKRITRRFVRHQANWFSEDDPRIHWVDAGPGAVEKMEALIVAFLKTRCQNNYL
jgi:tRNA dimethylallyltransferase